MLTTFIIFLALIVIGSIIVGVIQSDNSDFTALYATAIVVVLTFAIVLVIKVNEDNNIVNSKTIIKPSMKIETIQNDSNIIKSDTTYIYKFKNNN